MRKSQAAPLLTRRGFVRSAGGTFAVLAAMPPGSVAYAATEAATSLLVTDYRLAPPGWPADHRLTVTVIADLHAGGPNMGLARVRHVVDAANALKSDIIFLLGDYFATHRFVTERVQPAAWGAELGRLQAPLGVYGVLGNHDWWHDVLGVRRAFAVQKIPLLENKVIRIERGSRGFWIAGLGDQIAHFLGPNRFRGEDDLEGTLAQVKGSDPVILLAHEPDIFVRVPQRVTLTIAGHTHGGQIKLPFLQRTWAPSEFGARFAYGHIVEDERHMIVSGGLGCSKVPLRFGVPPEIVRITLGS